MKLGAFFGWAIVMYSVMYLAWSGLLIYGFVGSSLGRIVQFAVLIVVSTIATRALRLTSWKDVLPYSAVWAVLMACLDAIFAVPYTGWMLYTDWNVWVGYAAVLLLPIVVARLFRSRAYPATA